MNKNCLIKKKPSLEKLSPQNYIKILEQIKADIYQTQLRATLSITKELIMLYWRIGKMLIEKTRAEDWGSKPLERLSKDLKTNFPDITGFSVRNL